MSINQSNFLSRLRNGSLLSTLAPDLLIKEPKKIVVSTEVLEEINFSDSQVVQVKRNLFVFTEGRQITVQKLGNLTGEEITVD